MRLLRFALPAILGFSGIASAGTLDISYDVSLGGARIMAADFTADKRADQYTGRFHAKTTGVSKLFSKVRLELSVNGRVAGGKLAPLQYHHERSKNGKAKERAVAFTNKGKVVTEGQDYPGTLLPALDGTLTDPISGLLTLTVTSKPCNMKLRAFDGRDVFDISTKPAGGDGNRLVCSLTYTPVAGNDVDEGDTDAKTYELTLVKATGDFAYIPIMLTGSSKGVPFDVTATNVNIDGTAFSY